jgi:hypothetical protein
MDRLRDSFRIEFSHIEVPLKSSAERPKFGFDATED